MKDDKLWSALFACATAILMVGILLLRTSQPPGWAFLVFPAVGATLAHLASRTAPSRGQIMWLETSTIAAACVIMLVLLINGFLLDMFVTAFADGGGYAERIERIGVVLLAMASFLLWWALERRIKRFRGSDAGGLADEEALSR